MLWTRSPIYHRSGNDDDKSRKRSKHLAAAKESPKKGPANLWRWADGDEAGRKGKGKSGKKKVFHQLVQRGAEEIFGINDCAVFMSGARLDRPYVSFSRF